MSHVIEMHDIDDDQYIGLDGNAVTTEDPDWEWLESDRRGNNRYLIDGDSVWLNEASEEVE